MKKTIAWVMIIWLSLIMTAHAVTDGGLIPDSSIGTLVEKLGQVHKITGGTIVGNNLFHSFSEFNVETGETANFIGNQTLANIISRVTGTNNSWIDGVLKTTDTSANLYLMNPNGVMFGANASLDLNGSFHMTTANYLKFEDGKEFHANAATPIVTSAPVEAFGFLGTDVGTITLNGTKLTVSDGKSLSLIGEIATVNNSTLKSPGGRNNMASVVSAGEVKLTDMGIDTGNARLGDIVLDHSGIDASNTTSSSGVGQIFMRVNDLSMETESSILADNYSSQDQTGLSVKIETDNLTIKDGGFISATTYGNGNSGDVLLNITGILSMSGETSEQKSSMVAVASGCTRAEAKEKGYDISDFNGDAGNLHIRAENIKVTDGAWLDSTTYGQGSGGKILLKVTDSIQFMGYNSSKDGSNIRVAAAYGSGNAGSLEIKAKKVEFKDFAYIVSLTGEGTGDAGTIAVMAEELISLNGPGYNHAVADGQIDAFASSVHAMNKGGKGGYIGLNAPDIILTNGASISTGTQYTGRIITGKEGHGGYIGIIADSLILRDGSKITANVSGTANGGDIFIGDYETILSAKEKLEQNNHT